MSTALCQILFTDVKDKKNMESVFTKAFLDSDPFEADVRSVDSEVREVIAVLAAQKAILKKYSDFRRSSDLKFEINDKTYIEGSSDQEEKIIIKTDDGMKSFSDSELEKKTGRNIQQTLALNAAMEAAPLLAGTGASIRREIFLFTKSKALEKSDRKSLIVVHKDMKENEVRQIISFLKNVMATNSTGNNKITGDVLHFIRQAEDLGLLDSKMNKEFIKTNLILMQEVKDFQAGKPLIIVGQNGLEKYKDLGKTLLLNSNNSFEASMTGVFAFLSKNPRLIEQLQKGLKKDDSELKKFADNLSDERMQKIKKAVEIIVPEMKPLLESVLSQLADEEETVLIAG